MMYDVWTLLWLLVCLTILISILESIYRRIKERQLRQQEVDLQRQIQAQQYHVYTVQPLANPLQRNSLTPSSVLSQQQQEFIHQQQELKAANDLPPKYEDVVGDLSYRIPIEYTMPSSSAQRSYDTPPTEGPLVRF
ncbi:uncharacterized protein LOC129565455 [Sitodiplosis mosellana]|uniref:uncharacterized protein LOC129565455 n=1 Tax=Sitodiplosis mosellana TaxID=263140 RepID=UPI002444B027|nr:uncharacterized protein LOC129565455 [Sitodiplosis mosellana]XP_055296375.1 uncharacterized protein LOC129565455 [Sitodiplosis mosellana]XP_055296376.1 uncharacterized protein LOC129565455 [Sitodiplosis mosellana]